jgi:hypothetical protein
LGGGTIHVTHAPGAVSIQRAEGVVFSGNVIEHVATTGLDIALGSQYPTVSGNVIADTGICGINVGDYNDFWITGRSTLPRPWGQRPLARNSTSASVVAPVLAVNWTR